MPLQLMQRKAGDRLGIDQDKFNTITIAQIKDFFESEGAQKAIDEMGDSGQHIYHAEINENTLLYTPPGWILAEKGMAANSMGIMAHVLVKTPEAKEGLASLSSMLSAMSLTGSNKQMQDFVSASLEELSKALEASGAAAAADVKLRDEEEPRQQQQQVQQQQVPHDTAMKASKDDSAPPQPETVDAGASKIQVQGDEEVADGAGESTDAKKRRLDSKASEDEARMVD